MNGKLKIMIAGAANPHIPGYCRGFAGNPDYLWEIVAVADHDEKRLDGIKKILEKKTEVKYFSDWRRMLDALPDVSAAQIGGDNIEHFAMWQEMISRKLHIYGTKVVSMDPDECQKLEKMTSAYDRVIQIELELHFNPQFAYAKKLVQEGRLGKIESIYLTNVSQSPCNYYPNWGDPELSYGSKVPVRPGADYFRGGAITDHPHPFDLIRWITGREFKNVYAESAPNQRAHLQVEDHAAIIGELDDGTAVFINPSYSNLEEKVPSRRLLWPKSLECNLKITGDKGYYAADYFDKHIYVVGPNYPSPDRLIVDGTGRHNPDPENTLTGSFAACVRGERAKPESSLADGVAAVKVMNAAYESIYYGKTIEL
jgi:predicted dehydrogenase